MARLFDVIENPLPGWRTRKLKFTPHIDDEPKWTVQLIRERDGAPVEFTHESLHIAWVRAIEAAHGSDIGLNQDDGEDAGGQSRS